ncbi:DUF4304 domain-containing protein [Stenotrophobium rhamnosiphilum]|uniref:DUF4304 domain-containing protein n=1 Tax=Stenotrophobium rhamnosiphilum TaxID=2029166 RepID=A0A2T5MDB6_9GAMM|nr:DUF4304 domain-containing protein [Stenotrophobium rhamnosiphilum]PTU30565.1 hypothetical protein CJD38_13745 [Stenotrophobium rhamnosiphilum]
MTDSPTAKSSSCNDTAKILRLFAKAMAAEGFTRKSTWFCRERGHVVQFLHVHKFSFGPDFRIHVCIRVLNDPRSFIALLGISSDEDKQRPNFQFESNQESLKDCAQRMAEYIHSVGLPWLESCTLKALLAPTSVLPEAERQALRAALDGKAQPENITASRKLLGLAQLSTSVEHSGNTHDIC